MCACGPAPAIYGGESCVCLCVCACVFGNSLCFFCALPADFGVCVETVEICKRKRLASLDSPPLRELPNLSPQRVLRERLRAARARWARSLRV